MRIYVASWFFPPSTSSEGIVSYKLFRNSRHQFDVCSSLSVKWSYKQMLPIEADNIQTFPIRTDDLDEWVSAAAALFDERHRENPYDAIMTRSMPPESILVAQKIRESYPDIVWIASLADPIAKEPYHIKGFILESDILDEEEKAAFLAALKTGCAGWTHHENEDIRYMCSLKDIEDYAINNASGLIFPHEVLKNYILSSRKRKEAFSVPHTYDSSLYPALPAAKTDSRKTITFLGHSDQMRSLEPLVRAAYSLKNRDEHGLDSLHIRLIGNIPEEIRALVFNYYLHNHISIEPSVDYVTSLEIMNESDWLLHIDAEFDFLPETGNSIYFAGKLADYMGTDTPIMALTGRYSPADEIVRKAGGICLNQRDIGAIAEALGTIANDTAQVPVDRSYRDRFDAVKVTHDFDERIEAIVHPKETRFTRDFWPEIVDSDPAAEKLLTICVPSYKVQCYLDRCLFSLVSSEIANKLDIIVVNDGSPDSSREIGLAYQEHYPSVVRLVDKENGGHGSTINTALEKARGLYFRVLDGDDWVDGTNLTHLMNTVVEKELYADLISTNYHQVFCEDGAMVAWMKIGADPDYTLLDFETHDFTEEYFTIHSSIMKTELLRNAHFKIQEHTYYVDVEYTLFPIPFVKTVMFAPDYIYRYAVGNADQSINPEVFVNRYDHHDRVIRRMLTYLEDNRSNMSQAQIDYVESLFQRHLLRTHYVLGLMWDSDRERGYARSKDFDGFLNEINPRLYEVMRKNYRGIAEAQNAKFDPDAAEPFTSLEKGFARNPVHAGLKKLARIFAKTPFGEKVVYNRFTATVSRRIFR